MARDLGLGLWPGCSARVGAGCCVAILTHFFVVAHGLLAVLVTLCVFLHRIVRAFLIEEQKIVKKVIKAQNQQKKSSK